MDPLPWYRIAAAPTADVCVSISSFAVAYRHVENLQVKAGRTEEEVKIAEGVEVTQVRSIGRDFFVIVTTQDLGAA